MTIERADSLTAEGRYHDLCQELVSMDKSILFCAISEKSGYLVSIASKRNNDRTATLPLSDSEVAKYSFQAGIVCGLQKSWERQLGFARHFICHYDNMPVATILLDDGHFLIIGIDSTTKHSIERILSHKIMPYLQKGSAGLLIHRKY